MVAPSTPSAPPPTSCTSSSRPPGSRWALGRVGGRAGAAIWRALLVPTPQARHACMRRRHPPSLAHPTAPRLFAAVCADHGAERGRHGRPAAVHLRRPVCGAGGQEPAVHARGALFVSPAFSEWGGWCCWGHAVHAGGALSVSRGARGVLKGLFLPGRCTRRAPLMCPHLAPNPLAASTGSSPSRPP